jgi:hypothetical protein
MIQIAGKKFDSIHESQEAGGIDLLIFFCVDVFTSKFFEIDESISDKNSQYLHHTTSFLLYII